MELRGGHQTQDPRLDRIPYQDERSREFPIRALVGAEAPLKQRVWRLVERLNQYQEGACVGFGWAHELAARPIMRKQTNESARAIYKRAQQLDPWPGEDYSGTSVLAGAQAVQELGFMDEYRWAFGVDDVLATLANHGPVVIGVDWHQGMTRTDSKGFIYPTGDIIGGHCVVLRGLLRVRGGWVVLGRNSWGIDWGLKGDFKMHARDLDTLLKREYADACVPVLRR